MLRLEYSTQQLCMELLMADTEKAVIDLLRQNGFWEDPDAWLPFGGREDNFSTIGNQSGSADQALVEKLVNSVDAVLMGECWAAGIRPNSQDAPRSIPEAVATFFYGDPSKENTFGHIDYWPQEKRRQVSNRITLAATGSRAVPSFTIVDMGEGQTPQSMPLTLLSLDGRNKVDIHFVQGKFNMGGTGALRFCGNHNLQLIISRRNPNIKLADPNDPTCTQWGFTIVRRENPTDSMRLSTYKYLAPEGNKVLSFDAESLPLFPNGRQAYVRDTRWGTAVKLYEYKITGKSHILLHDGLMYRLDILLPRIALPMRLHECRSYVGHDGSFATTLSGLSVRLNDDRRENLEPGFPTSSTFAIANQHIAAEIYAFKRGKDASYRKGEGIIFTVNGQTHGSLSKSFFSRRSVGMNRLEDSIMVVVDCSRISGRSREDLFMNSRDRMEQGEFLRAIESELESILKTHQLLRELRERRKREEVEAKLEDSKPFKEALESILRKSPSLASLFGTSGPLSDPFRSQRAIVGKPFEGKSHPTFFRFQNRDYGHKLQRRTPINQRSRINFETDVSNNYFTRSQYAGDYVLRRSDNAERKDLIPDHNLNLHNGVATLNLEIPTEASVGDSFMYELLVRDDTLVEPFVNQFVVSVGPDRQPSGHPQTPRQRPTEENQNGTGDIPGGLALPTPIPVYESEWGKYNFNKYSALKAIYDPPNDDLLSGAHSFYINMDNIYLNTELKTTKESAQIVKSKWTYGMVLIAMALLRSQSAEASSESVPETDHGTIEAEVYKATAAIAPVLLPLIQHLGALSEEEIELQDAE